MTILSSISSTNSATFYAKLNDPALADGSLPYQNVVTQIGQGQCFPVSEDLNVDLYSFNGGSLSDKDFGSSFCVAPGSLGSQLAGYLPSAYLELLFDLETFGFVSESSLLVSGFSLEFLLSYQPELNLDISSIWSDTVRKTIVYKEGLIEFVTNIYHSGSTTSSSTINLPHGLSLSFQTSLTGTKHYAITYDISSSSGIIIATACLYINGILSVSANKAIPNKSSTTTDSLFFLGRPIGQIPTDNKNKDKWTTPIRIAEIALHNRALSYEEVSNRQKSLFVYNTVLVNCGVTYYNNFSEVIDPVNQIVAQIGEYNTQSSVYAETYGYGTYGLGNYNKPFRGVPNPTFIELNNTSQLVKRSLTTLGFSYFQITFSSNNSSTDIVSSKSEFYPFKGFDIRLQNSAIVIKLSDTIQSTIDLSQYNIQPSDLITLGILKNGYTITIFLNGIQVDLKETDYMSISNSVFCGRIDLNSSCPNLKVFEILVKNDVIETPLIKLLSTYGSNYFINGKIVENGVGTKTKIRVFSSKTGAFIKEQFSNDDGNYLIELETKETIDLIAYSSSTSKGRAIVNIVPTSNG